MKAQDLKNSVLQLAIQGKLVKQNENDEPASVLLEKIKEEKEKLIKEKKIKKEKPLPEISEEEKPFEIPESWEWVRLGDIGSWGSGATPSRTNPSYYGGNIPWLKTGELKDGYINSSEEFITEEALNKTSVKLNKIGSVLIAMYGATIGRLGILNIEATTNQACCACNTFLGIYNKYLFYYLLSQREELKSKSEGGAQPNISKEKIVKYHIPLPPLEEQKRIVSKLEEVLEKIEEYDKVEKELTELEKVFPQDIKKSILQYAIEGKLVEQNPEDEKASVLLEKIKNEKEKLIKEKKIKKEKPLPEISEEEKPFEIPESWQLVRLGEIIQLISGQDMKPTEYNEKLNGIPYITGASNIENGKLIINRWTEFARTISIKNDILLTCKGTVGKTIIQSEDKVHIARQIMAIRCREFINNKYIKLFIDSYVSNLQSNAKSMIPGISRDDVREIIIPLPPLEEQKRIVSKIESIFSYIDKLQNIIENKDLINIPLKPKEIELEDKKELISN